MNRIAQFAAWMHALAHHDFCPWANRYVYWLKQPIGWLLVGATASLLIGFFFAPQGFVMFAAIIAAIVCGVAWPWMGLNGVTCELEFERKRAREGEPVRAVIRIHNRWPWPLFGLFVENGFFLQDRYGENATAFALARVPGWSRCEFVWEFHPPRRGVYPDQDPQLATGFPFGIWQTRRPIRVLNELLVWPLLVPLDDVPALRRGSQLVAGIPCDRGGDEGDVIGARPYRRGDSLRHIHWAQTARRGTLVVRERQSTLFQAVRIVVDPRTTTAAPSMGNTAEALGSSDQDPCEWVIRVAASLCHAFHSHGVRVELTAEPWHSGTVMAPPGATGLRAAMDTLARLDLTVTNVQSSRKTHSREQRGGPVEIRVTSHQDAVATPRQRLVLVAPDSDQERTAAWLAIDPGNNPARELLHQWEKVCHAGW